ncbi:MAG: heme-binding protein [Myxococcota bacterium]|nr:heme-binding protein [Myxococcota bacterium]
MQTSLEQPAPPLPSFFDHFPAPSTSPKHAARWRKIAFLTSLAAVPAAAVLGGMVGGRRTALLAGGLAALGLGALRWQLARWFTETPAYQKVSRIGDIEVREYPLRIEARAETDATDFEGALARGFGRLACYIYGANTGHEDLEVTTPILTSMRDGVYTTAFVMPPHRAISSLPRPDDARIELREVAGTKLAAFPFRGRFTRDNIEHHERRFLRALLDAGLVARGSVALATYDSPMTVPQLRRNELWINLI